MYLIKLKLNILKYYPPSPLWQGKKRSILLRAFPALSGSRLRSSQWISSRQLSPADLSRDTSRAHAQSERNGGIKVGGEFSKQEGSENLTFPDNTPTPEEALFARGWNNLRKGQRGRKIGALPFKLCRHRLCSAPISEVE